MDLGLVGSILTWCNNQEGLARVYKRLDRALCNSAWRVQFPRGDHRPYDIFHQLDMLWPGLLGTSKYEFAKTYCEAKMVQGAQGKVFQFGAMVFLCKINSLEELNVLLTQTVMIRRLKEHLLVQLPPKRQQIISLVLGRLDINMAVSAMKEGDTSSMENRQETKPMANNCSSEDDDDVSGIPKSVSESDA